MEGPECCAVTLTYYTVVYCSGQLHHVPTALWDKLEGPKPADPASFINNGCTLSPDRIAGKPTWPACVVHDYHYNHTDLSREEADARFRRNLFACLKAYGTFTPVAWALAFFYWRAVRRAGRSFYNGSGDPS